MSATSERAMRGSNFQPPSCPESHYWFVFWLKRGWSVTCTRCGEHQEPAGKREHEATHQR